MLAKRWAQRSGPRPVSDAVESRMKDIGITIALMKSMWMSRREV
jgi:hypothetical protein